MNLKKLAILLGVAVLCSFADAKATVKVNTKQSSTSTVKTPEVQSTNNLESGLRLIEEPESGPLYSTRVGTDEQPGGEEGPNTNIATKNSHQAEISLRANLP